MKLLAAAVSGILLVAGSAASADAAVKVGVLRCYGAPKVGAVIGSVQEARCVFTSANGHHERYAAQFTRVGLDVGVINRSELVWSVYANTILRRRALTGDYIGASADASAGVGAGVNVLVGGNSGTVSLQPVSVKGETGVAVGAGAGRLQLR